jgi:flavin-dependent dehydrogenase
MKILIIGGGISGLYLSKKLAERGEEVVLCEKKTAIGKEACSGLFSSRILEFITESESLIENRIKRAYINFPQKRIELVFKRQFLVMNHKELDLMVFGLAKKAGARIITGVKANWKNNDFDLVIAADGALSETRREMGLKEPRMMLGIQGFVSGSDKNDFVETWPIKNSGFFWKIPRGKTTEWGIMAKPILANRYFNDFLQQRNLKPEKIVSALIPQGLVLPKSEKITLIGDAAGLTKPWSGGGVVWSLMAADILLEKFPDFSAYRQKTFLFFKPRIFFSKLTTKIGYFIGFNFPALLPKKVKMENDFLL